MARTDLPYATWRTSTYSNIGGECVEVAADSGVVGVRDTKDRAGVVLTFSPLAWERFASRTKHTAG